MLSREHWAAVLRSNAELLSPEERRVVEMLAIGKSTPAIAADVGEHRSMVWRKILQLAKRFPGAA